MKKAFIGKMVKKSPLGMMKKFKKVSVEGGVGISSTNIVDLLQDQWLSQAIDLKKTVPGR